MKDLLPLSVLTQQLMQRSLQKKAIELPFAKTIFLLETHIAGLHYHDIKQVTETVQVHDALKLRREPANTYDELAIEVLTLNQCKLGYLPKHRNPILARLMDAGKSLIAEVASIKKGDDSLPYYRQEPSEDNAITDIRLKISLYE
ncbi:MAG: HIRAN domain-containing protein [Methylicorpusculum sp.]|uniref:HIRAN domain-containing protein n=1 Tax=Methylicorpusculum sp. TaxID=2713644 RepID=UPI00271F1638|nr:HIRAN domain-containing protein [Methylicorpusculum sp.]MDO8938091.1 HIRAN domain-containing protein [Methylicorpusculum sp.]MDP2178908.1 HIRAN domain-containing protein [Methylicorpusculum sp.]MDP3530293.1 HIRAN domain-containing protein [Methylicorpusculum sp.]